MSESLRDQIVEIIQEADEAGMERRAAIAAAERILAIPEIADARSVFEREARLDREFDTQVLPIIRANERRLKASHTD